MGWTFYNSSGQRLQAFGFVAATQAEMEAGSSTTAYVTPGRTQYHPGVAKAWLRFIGTDSGPITPVVDYNVDDVTDHGTGDYTPNWGTDFSSINYAMSGMCSNNAHITQGGALPTAAGCRFQTENFGGSNVDAVRIYAVAHGDQ